jgi:hypothetical protein
MNRNNIFVAYNDVVSNDVRDFMYGRVPLGETVVVNLESQQVKGILLSLKMGGIIIKLNDESS